MNFNNFGSENPWGSMNTWGAGFENGSMGNSFAGPFSAPGSGGFLPNDPGNYGSAPGMGSNGYVPLDINNSLASGFNLSGATEALKPSFMDSMIGTTGAPGWGGMALGAVGGLASTYLGMKQYGLAKQSLAQNKDQFNRNYKMQKDLTMSRLKDRQESRVRSGSGYQSVGDYMKQFA